MFEHTEDNWVEIDLVERLMENGWDRLDAEAEWIRIQTECDELDKLNEYKEEIVTLVI